MKPVLWADLTWEEIGALAAEGPGLVLLPVGAVEQHGPHLGVGMDFIGVERVTRAASARTGIPVLPTLPYGCSLGHSRKWPGTLSLSPETLTASVFEIYDWLQGAGFHRLLIVNGHVGNGAPLRCAIEKIRHAHDDALVALLLAAEVSPRVRAEFRADADDWHGNAAETSLMMAEAPEQVRPDKIAGADEPDRTKGLVFSHRVDRTSANGVTGKPSAATLEQGRRLFGWMVEDLCSIVRQASLEEAPLEEAPLRSA